MHGAAGGDAIVPAEGHAFSRARAEPYLLLLFELGVLPLLVERLEGLSGIRSDRWACGRARRLRAFRDACASVSRAHVAR